MKYEPFTITVQVLERHKIHVPNEVQNRILSLATKTEAVTAIAMPGHFGGIQIDFSGLSQKDLLNRMNSLERRGKATIQYSEEDWTLLARYVSNAWPVTFSFYKGTFTLVLPNVAREIGLIPQNKGETVLIFLYGQIFEIWRPDAWIELFKSTKSKIGLLHDELCEAEAQND